MAIKTIDISALNYVEIEGTKVGIKVLTNGQVQKLARDFAEVSDSIDAKIGVIAGYVTIDGVEDTLDFLLRISNPLSQAQIIFEVFNQNRLTPVEEKNSDSSSAGNASVSATGDFSTETSVETKTLEDALHLEARSLEP